MKLINTYAGYDFYKGYTKENIVYYNIVLHGEKNPNAGYHQTTYILNIKGFKPEDKKYFEEVKTLNDFFPKGSITEVYGIKSQLLKFLLDNDIPPTDHIINQIELVINLAIRNSRQR